MDDIDKILTLREVEALDIIVNISTNRELKRLAKDALGEHYWQCTLRDISRRVRIVRRRVLGR